MMTSTNLDKLNTGETAVICSLSAEPMLARRFRELGLISGTEVECLRKSPLGDPVAYRIRGAVIALRKKDAATIGVMPLTAEEGATAALRAEAIV